MKRKILDYYLYYNNCFDNFCQKYNEIFKNIEFLFYKFLN